MAGSLSLAVAVGAVLSALALSISFGFLAAWRPGSLLAGGVAYFIDLLQTIPFIVLAVALAAVFRLGFIGIAPARLLANDDVGVLVVHGARTSRHPLNVPVVLDVVTPAAVVGARQRDNGGWF